MDVRRLPTVHLDGFCTAVVSPGWIWGVACSDMVATLSGHQRNPMGETHDCHVDEKGGEDAVFGEIHLALKGKTVAVDRLKPLASYESSGDTDSAAALSSRAARISAATAATCC